MSNTYLVRFFINRETGKQQRHLMLDDCSWVLGEWIGAGESLAEKVQAGGSWMENLKKAIEEARFFEERFSDDRTCVSAFERIAEQARADGYVLVDLLDRMVDVIPPDANEKPAWQQAFDRSWLLMLSGADDFVLSNGAGPGDEPLATYLRAFEILRRDQTKAEQAKPLALAARDECRRRSEGAVAMYTWSQHPVEFEACINDLLFEVHYNLKEYDAMFGAVRRAHDLAPNTFRSENLCWAQCYFFPQYRADAFETAFRYAEFGYENIKRHSEYAAFAARREAELRTGKPRVRWKDMRDPSTETDIAKAEAVLGMALPPDYRRFLASLGRSQLTFEYPGRSEDRTQHAELSFFGADDLQATQKTFQHWIDTIERGGEGLTDAWPATHGVSRHDLLSVATPFDNSSCLVISSNPVAKYGQCYLWHHDEAFELVPFAPSFGAAIERFEKAFLSLHKEIYLFFNMSLHDGD